MQETVGEFEERRVRLAPLSVIPSEQEESVTVWKNCQHMGFFYWMGASLRWWVRHDPGPILHPLLYFYSLYYAVECSVVQEQIEFYKPSTTRREKDIIVSNVEANM